jgi:hypothetical protein
MKTRILFVMAAAALAACGPSGHGGDDTGADAGGTEQCSAAGAQQRCNGAQYQTCTNGTWQTQTTCVLPDVCAASLGGCAACDPSHGNYCVGSEIHTCNADGTQGGLIQTCGFEGCNGGSCGGSDCSADAKLIYVVDKDYNFLSFDPTLLPGNPFHLIGQLSCPAGPSLPGYDSLQGPSTPFSMSVDRSPKAWVLYTSGQIFDVDVTNASCTASPWTGPKNGFELFGMGFVSDSAGATTEHLFIAGGAASATNMGGGMLGSVDPSTLAVQTVGNLPNTEYGPELTGTGNAELWGYFPGTSSTFVSQIDKSTGQTTGTQYPLPNLTGTVTAWAFAHYGGSYYVFVSTSPDLGTTNHNVVYKVDPMTNQVTAAVQPSPYTVVGAGVSTCAPVVVN